MATPSVAGLPEALTTYRQRPMSVSANKLGSGRDTWLLYRNHLGLSPISAAYTFGHYMVRGALRHKAPALARRLGLLHDAMLPKDV